MSVRVVIVDDQAPFRSAARMVVDMTDGFEVVGEAENGEDSVDLVGTTAADLVLMDVNLPGIDGLEATRRILAANPAVKVLVLSTYEAADYGTRAVEAGAVGFLPKASFGPDELLSAWEGDGR